MSPRPRVPALAALLCTLAMTRVLASDYEHGVWDTRSAPNSAAPD